MTRDWCEKHWAIVQKRKINGIAATILMSQKLLDIKGFYDKCEGKAELINKEMEKIKPLCCYLGDEVMEEIFEQCKMPHEGIDGYG